MAAVPPTFSIIIPTYRRADQLRECLRSLAHLDYPHDRFEVLVVDDASPVPPRGVVTECQARLSVRLLEQRHAGPAAARNTGARAAKGDWLAFTDDDCLVAPGWLRALEDRLRAAPNALIGGRTVNACADNPYSTVSQLLIDGLYAYYDRHPQSLRFVTSNNLAMARSRFLEVGGFDESFPLAAGEDREFCARWTRHGLPIRLEAGALVRHRHCLTLGGFWKQQFGYGRGAYRFRQACLRAGQRGYAIGQEFWAEALRSCLRATGTRERYLSVTLLATSQAAVFAGLVAEYLYTRRSASA